MKKIIVLLSAVIALSAFMITANAENTLIMEDTCETERENVTLLKGAPDKSKYYHIEGGVDIGFLPSETSSDYLYELDIRFNNEGAGFSFMKNGKWNSCIRVKDGNFALQTGGNSFTKYTPIDFEKWYHLTFLGRTNRDVNPVTYGHIILEEYDASGSRVNKKVFTNVNLRNNAATHFINVFGCDIDNLKAYTPSPTSLSLASDGESVIAGGALKFTATAFLGELEMNGINSSMIEYAIYDETNTYPIEDENVSISPDGDFKTEPLTHAQTVTVRVTSKTSDMSDCIKVKILSGDVFSVKGIGINSDGTKITKVKVRKNYASYKEAVTFVVAFYTSDGKMLGAGFKATYGDAIADTVAEVPADIKLPNGFDIKNGKIKVFVVTTLANIDTGSAVKAKREDIKAFDSYATVITIKENADVQKITADDILYFDVLNAGEIIEAPNTGKTYVLGSVNKIDTLFEIVE